MMGAAGASEDKTYVDDVFSTDLWTGNDTARNITSGLDMTGEGGMVWIKRRNGATNPMIWDTERGTYHLETDGTGGQSQFSNFFTGFTGTGYSIGTNGNINGTSSDVVGWSFRKAPGFFDVVTYTGNQTARTISHSLGSVPGMIIIKCTSDGSYWRVYHRSIGATKGLELNSDQYATNETYWNSTSPTSSVFSLSAETAINKTGETYVAYIFAHDEQSFGTSGNESIIKCGSYTGSSSGVNINLGFEPQWVMVKRTDGSGSWYIMDTMRGFTASDDPVTLKADSANTEGSLAKYRITSTGFDWNSDSGDSGQQYVYMAIRRPHKPPTAGTEVFKPIADTATGAVRSITGAGFAPDLFFNVPRSNANLGTYVFDRIRGPGKSLRTLYSSAEASQTNTVTSFDMDGITVGTDSGGFGINSYTYTSAKYLFRRASGFMDVVNFVGNGSAQNITHNLSAAPELIFVKNRTWIGGGNNNWKVYAEDIGNTDYLYLNSNAANLPNSNIWNDTSPTSTQFTVGTDSSASGVAFISYLFASRSGISKVGTYSGTGSDVNVDCGFTNGARLILLKRTNSTGDWYVFDSARGIVSGNDPYTLLNTAAAEVTNTDYIDPLASGFTVTSSAPDALNVSGGTYLFLAIA